MDYLKDRMASLLEAFPEPFFNHAMAVKVGALSQTITNHDDYHILSLIINNQQSVEKANSIRGVMTVARDQGLGAECASLQVFF